MGIVPYQRDKQLLEHLGMKQSPEFMDQPFDCGEAFTELALLLPSRDLGALEQAASTLGLFTGHFLRRLISGWLRGLLDSPNPEDLFPGLDSIPKGAQATHPSAKTMRLSKQC